MKKITIVILTAFISLLSFAQQRIPLNATDAYANQHAKDDFNKLTDGNIATRFVVWNAPIKPYIITYPLDSFDNCKITQIKIYVNNGNPSTLKFYYERKDTKEKVLLLSYAGGGWIQDYQAFSVSSFAASKFIIESDNGSDYPEEVQLYGSYTPHTWPVVNRTASPLSDLFGVVVKPWDIASDYIFPEKIPSIVDLGTKRVRLYDDYQLNHDASGNLIFDHNLWHQTANIKTLKEKGITTQQCYLDTKYYPFTGDKLNPETYLLLGKDVYAFGVHNKANGDQVKTFEVENELNRWYGNFETDYMDGYQLACMMSVCYDGHGKYPNVGMKASGSQAEVSICGLAEAEPYLLYQMMEWSKINRGYRADGTIDLPFDIYSFHLYSSLEGQRQGTPGGVPPEYAMAEPMRRLNEIRNRYFPWLKIHVGEWGWDISPNSPLNAPAFGKYSAQQTSAMWTIRALLSMAENGIDASSYYRIKSDYDALDDSSWMPFATMALLRQESGGVKQPDGSYTGLQIHRTLTGDYFKQLSEFFNSGWVFDSRVSASPNVLKFKKGGQEVYALWNTENMAVTDRPNFTEVTSTYSFPFSGTIKRFVDDGSGVLSAENYIARTPLTINSKPVFFEPYLTALPIRDRTPLPELPREWFTVKVYNIYGLLLYVKQTDDIPAFRRWVQSQMQIQQVNILQYHNAKKSFTEKIIKQ